MIPPDKNGQEIDMQNICDLKFIHFFTSNILLNFSAFSLILIIFFKLYVKNMDYQRLFQIIPKEPRRWTQSDVDQWLDFIGLGGLQPTFSKNAIDGACLEVLNDDDLTELGIDSNVKRKKLIQWIQNGFQEYKQFVRTNNGQSEWCLASKANKENKSEFMDSIDNLEYTPIQKISDLGPIQQQIQEKFPRTQIQQSFADNRVELVESMRVVEAPKAPLDFLETTKIAKYPTQQKLSQTFQLISYDDNKKYTVDETGFKIGRNQDSTLVLSQDYVSRNHCQIIYDKQFYLQDMGSTSGTFILLTSPSLLKLNLILHMGSMQYKITQMDNKGKEIDVVLRVVDGQQVGQKFSFTLVKNQTALKFGRHLEQFRNDTHLSNNHACFTYKDEGLIVQDMESRNGVWLRLSEPQKQSERIRITNDRQFRLGYEKIFDCQGLQ
ncbi:hypothetical protein pb186bvf_004287 [Paramecium bursaria]